VASIVVVPAIAIATPRIGRAKDELLVLRASSPTACFMRKHSSAVRCLSHTREFNYIGVNACYPTAAITLSSIAIGVGKARTSTVVRVGFGLAGPAKYSA
jgi:hypothetical protein